MRKQCEVGIFQASFVHDPVGPLAVGDQQRWKTMVFFMPTTLEVLRGAADGVVFAGGLPVALDGGAIAAGAIGVIGVLAIKRTEEVPLHVAGAEAREGGEIPWLPIVEIDLGDGVHAKGEARDLALQVIAHSSSSVG